jgi:hypothetical protein
MIKPEAAATPGRAWTVTETIDFAPGIRPDLKSPAIK